MELNAHAKINWDLHVLGRRTDGFHALDTVMVNVDLHDVLKFELHPDFYLTCTDSTLPINDDNLVIKAARALAKASGYTGGARIHLVKNIPSGGGMGGGSSDAACTLAGLNKLWKLNWPIEKLHAIAAQIGSDVSFFLYGGWRRCLGRGEIVEPLSGSERWPKIQLLLILPPFSIPTPPVYKALQAPPFDEEKGPRVLTGVNFDLQSILETLQKSSACENFGLYNSLTAAARKVEPSVAGLQKVLEHECAGRWLMSGSGSVHFVVLGPVTGLEHSQEDSTLRGKLIEKLGPATRVLTATTFTPLI